MKKYAILTAIIFILFAWLWLVIITEIRGKKTNNPNKKSITGIKKLDNPKK